jgi:hypothetical protein
MAMGSTTAATRPAITSGSTAGEPGWSSAVDAELKVQEDKWFKSYDKTKNSRRGERGRHKAAADAGAEMRQAP